MVKPLLQELCCGVPEMKFSSAMYDDDDDENDENDDDDDNDENDEDKNYDENEKEKYRHMLIVISPVPSKKRSLAIMVRSFLQILSFG